MYVRSYSMAISISQNSMYDLRISILYVHVCMCTQMLYTIATYKDVCTYNKG